MDRETRRLSNLKGSRIKSVKVLPTSQEGFNGDQMMVNGRLHVKDKDRWIDIAAPSNHSHDIEWYDMVLENSWVAYSSSFSTPSYAKDDNGFVYLKGLVKNGSSQAADITSLPAGYRPTKAKVLMGITNGNDQCRITVATDGDIYGPTAAVGDGGMDTTWVSFDGMFFHIH